MSKWQKQIKTEWRHMTFKEYRKMKNRPKGRGKYHDQEKKTTRVIPKKESAGSESYIQVVK